MMEHVMTRYDIGLRDTAQYGIRYYGTAYCGT